jgi:hypothetical protein
MFPSVKLWNLVVIPEIILSPIIAPLWYKITNICILTSIVFYGYNSTIYVFFIFHKKQFYGVDIKN